MCFKDTDPELLSPKINTAFDLMCHIGYEIKSLALNSLRSTLSKLQTLFTWSSEFWPSYFGRKHVSLIRPFQDIQSAF